MHFRHLKVKNLSLAKSFLVFSATTFIGVITACLWLISSSYISFEEKRTKDLEDETLKIQRFFDDKLSTSENFLQYIGAKINQSLDKSPEAIARIVRLHRENFKDETFAWNIVSYVTPDNYLIIDSTQGLREEPILVTEQIRPWLKEARKNPWQMECSTPAFGLISNNDKVLPCGIAFQTKQKELLGYLTAGFSISKVVANIDLLVSQYETFLIFDSNGKFILSSEGIENTNNLALGEATLEKITNDIGLLDNPIILDDFEFSTAVRSQKYPFIFIIGSDKDFHHNQLMKELISKVFFFFLTGVIVSVVIVYFGYRAIRPVVELSKAADRISKGKPHYIREYDIDEFKILAEQIQKISFITKELRQKQLQLTKLNDELQNANSFIKNNMSFLSHELINPISSIIGFSEMVKNRLAGSKDEELREMVDTLHKTAIHQNKQLNFFLRLFRFQDAGKPIDKKEIDLKQVMEWNVSMILEQARKKHISVNIKVKPRLTMVGDEIMIGQLIQNIASNGIKYNKEGGSLNIEAYAKNDKIKIIFQDTGVGISRSHLKTIFEKFSRIKTKNNNKILGYGIGLNYAQRCAIAHGGKILVKSSKASGTTFTVILAKS